MNNDNPDLKSPVTQVRLTATKDLVPGNVVRVGGGSHLRVRVTEINSGWMEGQSGEPPVGYLYAYSGRIINPEFLQTKQGRLLFGGVIPLDGSDLDWVIQGRADLLWPVEVEVKGQNWWEHLTEAQTAAYEEALHMHGGLDQGYTRGAAESLVNNCLECKNLVLGENS